MNGIDPKHVAAFAKAAEPAITYTRAQLEAAVAAEREACAIQLEGQHRDDDGGNCNSRARPQTDRTTLETLGCRQCAMADSIRARSAGDAIRAPAIRARGPSSITAPVGYVPTQTGPITYAPPEALGDGRPKKNTGCLECNEPDCPACHPKPHMHSFKAPPMNWVCECGETFKPTSAAPPSSADQTPPEARAAVSPFRGTDQRDALVVKLRERSAERDALRTEVARLHALCEQREQDYDRVAKERDELIASLVATAPRGSTVTPLTQAARLVGQRDGLAAALRELRSHAFNTPSLEGSWVYRVAVAAIEMHGGGE